MQSIRAAIAVAWIIRCVAVPAQVNAIEGAVVNLVLHDVGATTRSNGNAAVVAGNDVACRASTADRVVVGTGTVDRDPRTTIAEQCRAA